MIDKETQLPEREAIEALLPWYEKGQLDADDEARVEAYLADHPEMTDQLALIAEERAEAVLLNEARGTPHAGAFDRLMTQIEEEDAASLSLGEAKTALWGWASRLLGAPVPAAMQWVAAAAAIVIVVQGIALGVLTTSGTLRGPGYETASGPGIAVTQGTFALVQFAGDATAEDINGLLTEMGLTVVDGPKPGGVYKVRLAATPLEDAKRDTILSKLRSHEDVVIFAAPAQ